MRVAIEALFLLEQKTGIGWYVENLYRNLCLVDKRNDYILYSTDDFKLGRVRLPQPKRKTIRKALYITWLNSVFPKMVQQQRIDVLHCPNSVSPILTKPSKLVVTRHDMTAWIFPEVVPSLYAKVIRTLSKMSLERADMIIVPSYSSKHDMISILDIMPEKIAVTHLAADERFCVINDEKYLQRVRRKYRLPDRYILFVGALTKRKNLVMLLKAFAMLRNNQDLQLVLVGKPGWGYKEIVDVLNEKDLEGAVHLPGYVEDYDLPAVYNLAEVFVFPSLYEGFGIPLVEAMACGVPVIASNCSSIPEVTGDAAVLIPPNDEYLWAEKIEQLVHDDELKQQLSQRGIERARSFSWKRTAEMTIQVYSEVAGGR